MSEINLYDIKYYPDRFYVRLDGFDIANLTEFITNLDLGQQHAIFIHEYYHYLTNIATFPGVRQFTVNYCDRFRLVTILAIKKGLDAFPLKDNVFPECKTEIAYWNKVTAIINEDDLDYELVSLVEKSATKKFQIQSIFKEVLDETMVVDGESHQGGRFRIKIVIDGIVGRDSFDLTFGAIDEFLSSAIDEYLFEHDIAEINPSTLSSRPFYPYQLFGDLLRYYDITYPTSTEKILIAYFALNSGNPPVALIEILETMKEGGYEIFQKNPEEYLKNRYVEPDNSALIQYINSFSDQCAEQGRIQIAQALRYYGDRFYIAQQLKHDDFFFFVKPFTIQNAERTRFKQQFLLALARIIQIFTPPLILKDGVFNQVDKLTTMGEATTHIIATYEIFESLKTNRVATRPPYLKAKYSFPEKDDQCDNIYNFSLPPIRGSFRLALNELNLYKLYLKEANPDIELP